MSKGILHEGYPADDISTSFSLLSNKQTLPLSQILYLSLSIRRVLS